MGHLSDYKHSVWPVASGVYRLYCFPGRGRFAVRHGMESGHRTVLRNRIGRCSHENQKLLRGNTIAWRNESVWQVKGKSIWKQSHSADFGQGMNMRSRI